jgi:hypothetical protein
MTSLWFASYRACYSNTSIGLYAILSKWQHSGLQKDMQKLLYCFAHVIRNTFEATSCTEKKQRIYVHHWYSYLSICCEVGYVKDISKCRNHLHLIQNLNKNPYQVFIQNPNQMCSRSSQFDPEPKSNVIKIISIWFRT